jgi:hypothetical protein
MLPAASLPTFAEPAAPRTPRIFSAVPVTGAPADEPKPPVDSTLALQGIDTRRKTKKIPKSAHGRISALTTYGMTVEEVAEHYGVAASDIARIVSK